MVLILLIFVKFAATFIFWLSKKLKLPIWLQIFRNFLKSFLNNLWSFVYFIGWTLIIIGKCHGSNWKNQLFEQTMSIIKYPNWSNGKNINRSKLYKNKKIIFGCFIPSSKTNAKIWNYSIRNRFCYIEFKSTRFCFLCVHFLGKWPLRSFFRITRV